MKKILRGDTEMKKLLVCAAVAGGVAGAVKYMDKYGLPVLGNLTMNLPFKLPIDFWDIFTAGLMFADGKIDL